MTNRDLRTIYRTGDKFLNDKKGTQLRVHLTASRSCVCSVHRLLAVTLTLPFVSSRHTKMTLSWLKQTIVAFRERKKGNKRRKRDRKVKKIQSGSQHRTREKDCLRSYRRASLLYAFSFFYVFFHLILSRTYSFHLFTLFWLTSQQFKRTKRTTLLHFFTCYPKLHISLQDL